MVIIVSLLIMKKAGLRLLIEDWWLVKPLLGIKLTSNGVLNHHNINSNANSNNTPKGEVI